MPNRNVVKIAHLNIAATILVTAAPTSGQCRSDKLYASDTGSGDAFGIAVALLDDTLLVGSMGGDGPGGQQGSAYIFERLVGAWGESQKLLASDGAHGDRFGSSVALDGVRLLIGAPSDSDPNGAPNRGSAYVFERQGEVVVELTKLQSSDLGPNRDFGSSVALQGNQVLIGAPGDSNSGGGRAYLMTETVPGLWVETTLVPSDSTTGDGFGASVALSGDFAVIGAPHYLGIGAIYVFQRADTSWNEVAKLMKPPPLAYDWFGASVALREGRILVGSYYLSSEPREVVVFECLGNVWTHSATLAPSPPETASQWGSYLAFTGKRAFVVGPQRLDVFSLTAGQWEATASVELAGLQTDNQLTRLLAADHDWIGVGSPGDDDVANSGGAAFVLSLSEEATPYCHGTGCPCGNDDEKAGCANSMGGGARLAACGSTSVAYDDLLLEATSLPKNQFGIFFMGGSQIQLPFGDGLQCVGSGGAGIFRYNPAQNSGSIGSIVLGPGIVTRSQSFSASGRIGPGETWNFQVWYRDPMGSPCGGLFNLSNAVSVTFVP